MRLAPLLLLALHYMKGADAAIRAIEIVCFHSVLLPQGLFQQVRRRHRGMLMRTADVANGNIHLPFEQHYLTERLELVFRLTIAVRCCVCACVCVCVCTLARVWARLYSCS